MSDSITVNAAYFFLFLFIFIAVFAVLADPIDNIMDGILGLDDMTSSDEIDLFVPYYKTAARLALAIGIATPVVWFVAKMFSREPADYYYRRGGGRTF